MSEMQRWDVVQSRMTDGVRPGFPYPWSYHPDPVIDRQVHADEQQAEAFDLGIGYSPRRWICDCGASHARGHIGRIGNHRCMKCGYVGDGGTYDGAHAEATEKP